MPQIVDLESAAERRSRQAGSTQADYDADFFQWTETQSRLLRERRFGELDIENLVDEVETLGRSVKRELESRLSILVVHLLKTRFQPERRSRSWRATIAEQRRRLERELRENPSLKTYPAAILSDDYALMRLLAAGETNMAEETFPVTCPFTIEDILDPGFDPEAE